MAIRFTIKRCRCNVNIGFAVVIGNNGEFLTILLRNRGFIKYRAAYIILVDAGRYAVQSHRADDIP